MTTRCIIALGLALGVCAAPTSVSAQIKDPVRGQKYTLAPNNGPWMIMVTSFSLPPGVENAEEIPGGVTPAQAADKLVFELRSHGVPAYTYTMGEKTETIKTVDRLAEPVERSYTSQQLSVCVLAGNYQTINPEQESSATAIQTLEWIKHFRPKLFSADRPRAYVTFDYSRFSKKSRGRARLPLMGAFFTTNPLAADNNESNVSSERVELLRQLNSGSDVSLFKNDGAYTLVVASFHGQHRFTGGTIQQAGFSEEEFGDTLNQAARDAWQLATYMRQLKIDAYLWHDETCSVVTVGSFDSLEDPRIPKAMETYRAKMQTEKGTGERILTAEFLTLPHKPTPANPIEKRWIFDPVPRVMKVPKL